MLLMFSFSEGRLDKLTVQFLAKNLISFYNIRIGIGFQWRKKTLTPIK